MVSGWGHSPTNQEQWCTLCVFGVCLCVCVCVCVRERGRYLRLLSPLICESHELWLKQKWILTRLDNWHARNSLTTDSPPIIKDSGAKCILSKDQRLSHPQIEHVQQNGSAQGDLKFRVVSNSFWEGTRGKKTHLKEVSYSLTSYSVTTKCVLLHVVVLCFLQVSDFAIIGGKGCGFQLGHQFLAVFPLGPDMVMFQMSLYIKLDHHSYR